MKPYIRQPHFNHLWKALRSGPALLQAVIGPRQVGKTTLALQILEKWRSAKHYATADELDTPTADWIEIQWKKMRRENPNHSPASLLVLDEVQKIPHWSDRVKKLYDEDKRGGQKIRVLLLGSSSLLMQKGLTESLAGRFEIHHHHQWSFPECQAYFRTTLKEYLYFGGYPNALALHKDEIRWGKYLRESLIETILSKDILLLTTITKPILLRQSFSLAVQHPAQILSYQKMLGSLHDAGNTTTIASYLNLLSKAFLLTPLERWSGTRIRQRGSIPKILILDNGLVSALSGLSFKLASNNPVFWGRLVENAVGIQLYFLAETEGGELFYWRERDLEVDYVLRLGQRLYAIEVKSGLPGKAQSTLGVFKGKFKNVVNIILTGKTPGRDVKAGDSRIIHCRDFFLSPRCIL